ncbi:MAG: CoA-binding protein [Candidatus Tectimicrobiota bacterium]
MAFTNPPEAVLRALLQQPLTVAVVICSPDPRRDSHRIAGRLQAFGFRMIPVNPAAAGTLIHGEYCYARLTDIAEPVHLVDVFRRPDMVEPLVDDAIACGASVLWMQLGVVNETAARRAQEAGLTVVMDRCTSRDYRHFVLSARENAG